MALVRNVNVEVLMRNHARAILEESAQFLVDVLKDALSRGSRSGLVYEFGTFAGIRASAPGEYPQELTGDLRDSVDWRSTADKFMLQIGFFDEPLGKLI